MQGKPDQATTVERMPDLIIRRRGCVEEIHEAREETKREVGVKRERVCVCVGAEEGKCVVVTELGAGRTEGQRERERERGRE